MNDVMNAMKSGANMQNFAMQNQVENGMGNFSNLNQTGSIQNFTDSRSFEDSCKETLTIEQFCAKMKVSKVDIKSNPQKINSNTGSSNLFITFGAETGAVSNKVQSYILTNKKMPENLVISRMQTPDNQEVWTLHTQGNSNTVFSLTAMF